MRFLILLAVFSFTNLTGLFAQQQPNTVSVTVSTPQPVTLGTATFRAQFLDASLNSTLDSALGVLGSSGAAAANLSGVSVSINQGFVVTQYDFAIIVPAAQFAATRDKLLAAQRAIANVNSQAIGWTSSYSATDEDAAKTLEQAMPNLLSQAKQQAGVLAGAMGAKLGNIVAMSTPALVNSGLSLVVSATVTYSVQ
jgi:hypothetical protein